MTNPSGLRKQSRAWSISRSIFLIVASLWLFSCTNADFVRPKLPATPDLVGSNPYGVIKVIYAKGYAETNLDAMVLCLFRAGDQVEIVKRSLAQEKINGVLEYWYQVKAQDQLSWVFGSWMDQFPLEIQSKTAAVIIREKVFPQINH